MSPSLLELSQLTVSAGPIVVLLAAILLVNFSAAVYVVIGLVCCALFMRILPPSLFLLTSFVFLVVALAGMALGLRTVRVGGLGGGGGPAILAYNARLKALSTDSFRLQEGLRLQYFEGLHVRRRYLFLPFRTIHANSHGLFLRQVSFTPMARYRKVNQNGPYARIPISSGLKISVPICPFNCTSMSADVEELPSDSFYEVEHAQAQTATFLDSQEANWTIGALTDRVSFAYYVPPWQSIRAILNPFAAVTSLGSLINVLLGYLSWALLGGMTLKGTKRVYGHIRRKPAPPTTSSEPSPSESHAEQTAPSKTG